MDMDALKENVKTVIRLMPPEVQIDCGHLFHIVVKHLPTIEKIGPAVIATLASDIQTLAFEFATKTLNQPDMEKAIKTAFGECGIVLPELTAPVHPGV